MRSIALTVLLLTAVPAGPAAGIEPSGITLASALATPQAARALPRRAKAAPGAGVLRHLKRRAADGDCGACHGDERDYGHPTGFEPARALPPAYRLDRDGRFTCATCHRPRASGKADAACADCHTAGFFSRMADGGTSFYGRAHLPVLRAASLNAADALSMLCLDCHAGHGEDAGGRGAARLQPVGARPAPPRNHPIGMPYRRYESYGGFVPAALLPEAVRLPDGRLSCVSCHQSYDARHGEPVLPAAGSRLCFACHDL